MWFQQGRRDGLEFARQATYDVLAYAAKMETFQEFARPSNGAIEDYDPTKDAVLGDYFSKMADKYKLIRLVDGKPVGLGINPIFQQWEYGWYEGVCDYLKKASKWIRRLTGTYLTRKTENAARSGIGIPRVRRCLSRLSSSLRRLSATQTLSDGLPFSVQNRNIF